MVYVKKARTDAHNYNLALDIPDEIKLSDAYINFQPRLDVVDPHKNVNILFYSLNILLALFQLVRST